MQKDPGKVGLRLCCVKGRVAAISQIGGIWSKEETILYGLRKTRVYRSVQNSKNEKVMIEICSGTATMQNRIPSEISGVSDPSYT
jgi:hypothetical protein